MVVIENGKRLHCQHWDVVALEINLLQLAEPIEILGHALLVAVGTGEGHHISRDRVDDSFQRLFAETGQIGQFDALHLRSSVERQRPLLEATTTGQIDADHRW